MPNDDSEETVERIGVFDSAHGAALSPQTAIGPYRLLERIGAGGMGEVWLAEQHEPIRRRVALKVIRLGMDTERVVARFEAERQALAQMDHPGIAKVFDAGSTPLGRPYFVMEYVPGEPITDYCDRHKLTLPKRLHLFQMVCDAVQHAQQRGIIHRDLKPSNVLVTLVDNEPCPKIIDFGVAKATQQKLTERTLHTERGMLIGTPEYMSPEQAEGTGLDIDCRTDVYALGAILYELLTGSLPIDLGVVRQAGPEELRRAIREQDPPPPSERILREDDRASRIALARRTDLARLVSTVRGDLDRITMKAMDKDRTRRYRSPADLASDLDRYLRHEPVTARPPTLAYLGRKFVRRHKLGVTLGTTALLGIVVFAASMAWQSYRVGRERDRAEWVSKFLVSLFLAPDPSEARGQVLTAEDILDRGADRIGHELEQDPVLRSRVMAMLGRTYLGLGADAQAETLLRSALTIQRETLGPDHRETIGTLHNLALVCWDEGRYTEAEELYREAVTRGARALGESDPQTLTSMANLANTLVVLGRAAEAEELLQTVLERRRAVRGPNHLETLSTTIDLALLRERKGNYNEAERMLAETLPVMSRAIGDEHPETLKAQFNLALIYNRLARYDEAGRLFEPTLQRMSRVLGPEHPHTLLCMTALAMNRANLHRFDEADSMLRQVLEIQRRTVGERHPDTLNSLYNIACIAALKGDADIALSALEGAVNDGYFDADWMMRDSDLESLRADPRFEALVARARLNAPGR